MENMVNVISVANQKGGVGKTTTTINLAASIADRGYRVLIVDIDPQGNATSGLGIEKSEIDQDIYNVLIDEIPIQDTIHHTSIAKLDMVPATINLSGAETELISMMARETRLKSALDAISDQYDFIFNGQPAKGSASRGEVRSIMISLKFIEAAEIEAKTHVKPLILLDDVFSELDTERCQCLVENFRDHQIILTSTESY